jgi:hypothetical protein
MFTSNTSSESEWPAILEQDERQAGFLLVRRSPIDTKVAFTVASLLLGRS